MRAQRRVYANRLRRLPGKIQIFQHQRTGEPSLIAVVCRTRRHRPRHRTIAGQRPALSRRARNNVEQRLVRQPKLFAEHEGFADRDHRGAENEIVANLSDLPVAGLAAMHDALAHALKHRLAARESMVRAADHERQRRRPRAAASACALRALSTSMVEQSMNSVPCRARGTMSSHTDSTCSPPGSMVMTISASSTADRALATICTPSRADASRDAGTTSKPRTCSPDLTRLAAIGAPILPSPMNPIFDISP